MNQGPLPEKPETGTIESRNEWGDRWRKAVQSLRREPKITAEQNKELPAQTDE